MFITALPVPRWTSCSNQAGPTVGQTYTTWLVNYAIWFTCYCQGIYTYLPWNLWDVTHETYSGTACKISSWCVVLHILLSCFVDYYDSLTISFMVSSLTQGNQITRTTRTPAFWGYPPPSHDYPYHWVILDPKSKEDKVKVTNLKKSPKFQIFEFWNEHYTRHTFWSCLIRCANMKWIRWVFLKIRSGHDSVHRRTDGRTDRRTDGQGDTSIPPYQLRWSGGYNNPGPLFTKR